MMFDRGLRPGDRHLLIEISTERFAAAVETNQKNASSLVLTARAEKYILGNADLAITIEDLQADQTGGAQVLYTNRLVDPDGNHAVLSSIDLPLNALIMPGGPSSRDIFATGVRGISVGSAISLAAPPSNVSATLELLDQGTHEFWAKALPQMDVISRARSLDP